jgi:hypothetical protein
MYAIRARRKVATEKDFLEAVNKVIKSYAKVMSGISYLYIEFFFLHTNEWFWIDDVYVGFSSLLLQSTCWRCNAK